MADVPVTVQDISRVGLTASYSTGLATDDVYQIVNDGTGVLRYLALSTMEDPEVVEYPDSGKYGVIAGRPVGGRPWDARFHAFAFKKDSVVYWAGEE